jgi:XRE family transcriptional regulator, regulator of sulfur utilization
MEELRIGGVVRRLREAQALTLRALAERSGFTASFLSQLENDQTSPSISSMERIAGALGVTLGEFFRNAEREQVTRVVRAGARDVLYSQWSRAQIESLASSEQNGRVQPVLVTMKAGGSSGKRPHPAPSEEFALVLSGAVVLTIGENEQDLNEGDAVTIRAGTPRRWHNATTEPARMLVVATR